MKIKKDFIPLLPGIDLVNRQLPLLLADSGKEGPVVWLTAAIHGDEVTGTAVIQSVFNRFKYQPLLRGKLYAMPILNPTGFETISRRETNTEADLNRHFNGNEHGSTPERIAAKIYSTVVDTKPDYVIDLHSDSINSIPYIIIDLPKSIKTNAALKKSITIAQTLGFPWAVDTEKSTGYPLENCLTGRLISEGIPAVCVEIGWPYIVVDHYRITGLGAIWNFLSALGIVSDHAPLLSLIPEKVYTFTERVTTQSTGIIEYRVKPGEMITKNQILGRIRNVFAEKIETITSPVEGKLFSHEDQSVTFPGLTLFTLVVESDINTIIKLSKEEIPADEAIPERTG